MAKFLDGAGLVRLWENIKVYAASYIGGVSGEIYSTEETRIGTWIDGKPLYKKTFSFTTPSNANNSSQKLPGVTLNDVDTVVKMYGTFLWDDKDTETQIGPLPIQSSAGAVTLSVYIDKATKVAQAAVMVTLPSAVSKQAYLTCEYTKTTDQPIASPTAEPPSQEALDEMSDALERDESGANGGVTSVQGGFQ